MFKTLSVIIPVFNEKNTIEKCINRVLNADTCGLKLEIIISDNNSTDGTKKILQKIKDEKIKICYKSKNTGKGANMKNGLREANGDIILFQDADLEYSPENYPDLLKPILNEHADVVYGSRLTIFTDIATGYKVFKKNIIKSIEIKSDGFEIEPEITAKIAKDKKINIYEVPITIYSRSIAEGKKVRWWDFFIYIYTMIKWRIFK